jgi:hypothetical protein
MKTLSARRIARHFFCFPVRLLIATVQADREIVRTWKAINTELGVIERRERATKIGGAK